MRRLPVLLLALACLAGASTSAAAQGRLPTGNLRVRLTAPALLDRPVAGRVLPSSPDSLAIALGRAGAVRLRFPASALERIEVSAGRDRVRWAALGGGAGLLVGGVAGAWAGGHEDPSGFGAFFGMLGGAALGLVSGAVGGAMAAPERWDPWRLR